MKKITPNTIYVFNDGRYARTIKVGTKYVEYVLRHGRRGRFGVKTHRLPKENFLDLAEEVS